MVEGVQGDSLVINDGDSGMVEGVQSDSLVMMVIVAWWRVCRVTHW